MYVALSHTPVMPVPRHWLRHQKHCKVFSWIPVSRTDHLLFLLITTLPERIRKQVAIVFPKVNDKGIIKYLSYNGI
ncbi:hypothetical protein [Wolbachia endosymbiont of Nasonia giraulti]|uniref:hypothetical protein n=1 Tax=Wolbachia endosymbiont of Nasonia giraulti TaxID=180838 RepID=UPI003A8A5C62